MGLLLEIACWVAAGIVAAQIAFGLWDVLHAMALQDIERRPPR
jgi:hypothetical protein